MIPFLDVIGVGIGLILVVVKWSCLFVQIIPTQHRITMSVLNIQRTIFTVMVV